MNSTDTTNSAAMDDHESLKQLVRSLSVGVAIVDPATWSVVLENEKFFQWFPPKEDGDESLGQRIPALDIERAIARMTGKRPYGIECETEAGSRKIPLAIDLKPLADRDPSLVMVECQDLSKPKQTEYMLQSYSDISEKNTRELQREKDRVEKLLLIIMPKSVYEEIKDFGSTTPQRFDFASVLMLDFVDFTEMAVSRDPGLLISELNDIFSAFDRIVELFGGERIKTIGDAYMVVSSVPENAQNIARVALRMKRYLEKRNAAHCEEWLCRVGINSGPLIGSIVGVQKYVYDILGPGVNLASRMEENSEPVRITLCEETHALIKDEFFFTERGEFDIKGFGKKQLFFLDAEIPKGR